jgi:hypothetical protein
LQIQVQRPAAVTVCCSACSSIKALPPTCRQLLGRLDRLWLQGHRRMLKSSWAAVTL